MDNEMLPYMITELTNAQIMANAMQCNKNMNGAAVNTCCVPPGGDCYSAMTRSMAVFTWINTSCHRMDL